MLPRLAVPGLLLGVLLSAAAAPAATFRLQGATPGADGTFSVGAVANGRIRGEFSVLTDYRDKDGNVVNTPGNQLQAWNIEVRNGGTVLDRFVSGYSSPEQGGLADNSSKSAEGTRQFTLTCTDASASPRCTAGNTLTLAFAADFDTFIGDSTGGSTRTAPMESLVYNGQTATRVGTTLAAQADFIPLTPGLLALGPVALLLSRLRRSA